MTPSTRGPLHKLGEKTRRFWRFANRLLAIRHAFSVSALLKLWESEHAFSVWTFWTGGFLCVYDVFYFYVFFERWFRAVVKNVPQNRRKPVDAIFSFFVYAFCCLRLLGRKQPRLTVAHFVACAFWGARNCAVIFYVFCFFYNCILRLKPR